MAIWVWGKLLYFNITIDILYLKYFYKARITFSYTIIYGTRGYRSAVQ